MATVTRRAAPAGRREGRSAPEGPDRARDVWGAAILVLAILCALGLWGGAAGRIGWFLDLLFRGLFGVFGLVAPVALAVIGVVLLREPRPANRRISAGASMTALGVVGLWHLAAGAPAFDAAVGELHGSSGWLGAAIVLPLRAVAASAGAVVLLTALVCAGLMVATATTPREVAGWLAERAARIRAVLAERLPQAPHRDEVDATVLIDGEATVAVGAPLSSEVDTGPIYEGVVDGGGAVRDAVDGAPSDTATIAPGLDPHPDPGDPEVLARKLAPVEEDTWVGYLLPDLKLLRTGREALGNKKALDQMTRALEHTLAQFNVDAQVERVTRGPTVTRFEITLGPGVKVSAVTKLGDDIAYALATPEIRIVAPIPGKSAIGVEVPNRERDLITLGDILRSPEAQALVHPLTAGIGKDIAGNPVLINLARMPHLLIAGATGSGKSVTMNAIVTSVISRTTPREARMILIDPKRVELNHYDGAPHLLTPVVVEPKRAVAWLDWTVGEMEQRYERLALLGYRNLDAYNKAVRDGSVRQAPAISGRAGEIWQELPYILVVIDELADLMMVAPRDVENHIVRIAQMARAVGIHLAVATQRPSVDVVTGLIKANIPSRIALAMATQADSRTILDQAGAEKLVGMGDMLFMPANASKPHRIQGCYVDESEIERVVAHCRAQREPEYVQGVAEGETGGWQLGGDAEEATDQDLVRAAMDLVVRSGLGSTSMLQRKLKVGFARAGRLMDELEQMGVVGPSEGPKARQVLVTVEELEHRQGRGGPPGDAAAPGTAAPGHPARPAAADPGHPARPARPAAADPGDPGPPARP